MRSISTKHFAPDCEPCSSYVNQMAYRMASILQPWRWRSCHSDYNVSPQLTWIIMWIQQPAEGKRRRVTLFSGSVSWWCLVFDKQMESQKSDLNYRMMEWDGDKLACSLDCYCIIWWLIHCISSVNMAFSTLSFSKKWCWLPTLFSTETKYCLWVVFSLEL